MKPFDLEKALAGDPVITRDGRPVKIAGYNEDAIDDKHILGWCNNRPKVWRRDGRWSAYYDEKTDLDIFMAPKERKEWVVRRRRPNSGKLIIKGPFDSKVDAELYTLDYPDATIHEITITE